MTSNVQLHFTSDPVIEVQFSNQHDQAYVEMPVMSCIPYGLETRWGFRLLTPEQLAVFVMLRPGHYDEDPGISVGCIFPDLTLPVELKANGWMAIAIVDLPHEIDLSRNNGYITMYAERSDRSPWMQPPNLLQLACKAAVTGFAVAIALKGLRDSLR